MRAQSTAPVGGSTGGRYRKGKTGQTKRGAHSVVEARIAFLLPRGAENLR
jgi:hypothetical protein